jgi:NadR type nicotinamide-nucleotide adenylyltransferase
MNARYDHGLVIGKFDPFHHGHKHVIRTAEDGCQRVTVIACGKTGDSFPVAIRAQWLQAAHPAVDVRTVDQDALGLADDDSDGWAKATLELLDGAPDVVFTSEPYGESYSRFLGCRHVSVDPARTTVPISGSEIRANPLGNLRFLDPVVRAKYVLRVCLVGAESTGKTTLAAALADEFGTVWVPEFGHLYQALARPDPNGPWNGREFVHIARLQGWLEDFQAEQANRVLFCDTDLFTTALWHEAFVGAPAPDELLSLAAERSYDLFVLCDCDIPFKQDTLNLREDGHRRTWMQARYRDRLESSSTSWLLASGPLEKRVQIARDAVSEVLARRMPSGNASER